MVSSINLERIEAAAVAASFGLSGIPGIIIGLSLFDSYKPSFWVGFFLPHSPIRMPTSVPPAPSGMITTAPGPATCCTSPLSKLTST